jgi:hypothetical protein
MATDNGFIIIFPAARANFPAFCKFMSIMEGAGYWENNTYTLDSFGFTLNNGAYVAVSWPIRQGTPDLGIAQAMTANAPYAAPLFNKLTDGNLPANPGLTLSEFNGIKADMILDSNPSKHFDTWLADNGYTVDEDL